MQTLNLKLHLDAKSTTRSKLKIAKTKSKTKNFKHNSSKQNQNVDALNKIRNQTTENETKNKRNTKETIRQQADRCLNSLACSHRRIFLPKKATFFGALLTTSNLGRDGG